MDIMYFKPEKGDTSPVFCAESKSQAGMLAFQFGAAREHEKLQNVFLIVCAESKSQEKLNIVSAFNLYYT